MAHLSPLCWSATPEWTDYSRQPFCTIATFDGCNLHLEMLKPVPESTGTHLLTLEEWKAELLFIASVNEGILESTPI